MTKTLIEKALAGLEKEGESNNFSGILYLVPTDEKRREAQRLFHAALRGRGASFPGGYIPPLMLTPGQLARKLLRESAPFPLPSWLRAPLIMGLSGKSAGHAANVAALMTEIKGRFPGKKVADIIALLLPALSGLGIAEEVGERLRQTLGFVALYDEALEKNGFIDPADAAHAAAPLADGLSIRALILDGFYELSRAETTLVRALIEKAENGGADKKTFAAVPLAKNHPEITEDFFNFLHGFPCREMEMLAASGTETKKIKYFACPSSEAEVEAAARRIKARYISGAFTGLSSAVLAVPSLDGYADMIERVFVKYEVPCSLVSGAKGGAKRSARARMEKDLLRLFDALAGWEPGRECGGLEPSAIASIMSSPFFTEIPEELRALATRITLSAESGGLDNFCLEDNQTGVEPEWLIKRLSRHSFKNTKGDGERDGPLNRYLSALKAFGFSAGGYEDELEDRLNGLSILSELCPGPFSFSREVLGLISSGIEEEMEAPGVRVLDFRQAAGLEPESLYFLGLKDGQMPARPENDFFLPEKLRAALGLKTMKKALLIEEFLFEKLISSPDFIHLSYPRMEADKIFLPSIFISDGEPLPDPVYGVFSKEEELVRQGGPPYSANLKEIGERVKTKAKTKDKSKKTFFAHAMNVTDVDSFRACPRFFYMEKTLGLRPAEVARCGLEPRAAGILLHASMEALMPLEPADDSPKNLLARAGQAIDGALAQMQKEKRGAISPFWARLLKETFLAALPGVVEIEKKFQQEGFTRAAVLAERRLEGELKGARFKGKIDRMDENGEGERRILDYKTGAASLNPEDVLRRGTSLQLFLYAALAEACGLGNVRSVGIYSLRDLKVKIVPGGAGKNKKPERTIGDYVEAALGHLEETLEAISRKDFRAAPSSEQNCRRCHEKPYCPFIHREPPSGGGHGEPPSSSGPVVAGPIIERNGQQ